MWLGERACWTAKLPQAAPALEGCSPVQVDSSQGSGKYMGTQKGNVVRERLHGLLYSPLYFILFFPNSLPKLSPQLSAEESSATPSPTNIASAHKDMDKFLCLTQSTQATTSAKVER